MIVPKKFGIKTIVGFAVFAFVIYGTCFGGFSRIMSAIGYRLNAPTRARFEELLEEKYGEEFVCFDISSSGGGSSFMPVIHHAKCAPTRDKTLVFEAEKYRDDDSLLRDNYAKNIAEQQINEMMLPEISGMWENFALDCDLYNAWGLYDNEDIINKIREGELDLRFLFDEIIKYNMSQNYDDIILFTFTVCADDSTRNLSYEEEWEGFHKAAENLCASLSDYNVKIDYALFFSPGDRYNKCAKIVENHRYSGASGGWDSLESVLNWERSKREGRELVYWREIHIDTTHQAENSPSRKIPYWFDTAEDYAEFRAEMKT